MQQFINMNQLLVQKILLSPSALDGLANFWEDLLHVCYIELLSTINALLGFKSDDFCKIFVLNYIFKHPLSFFMTFNKINKQIVSGGKLRESCFLNIRAEKRNILNFSLPLFEDDITNFLFQNCPILDFLINLIYRLIYRVH